MCCFFESRGGICSRPVMLAASPRSDLDIFLPCVSRTHLATRSAFSYFQESLLHRASHLGLSGQRKGAYVEFSRPYAPQPKGLSLNPDISL